LCFGNETGLWEKQNKAQKNKWSTWWNVLDHYQEQLYEVKYPPPPKKKGSTAKCEYAPRYKEVSVKLAKVRK
jgi:hypothetical protein